MEKPKAIIADIRSNNNQGICTGHFYYVADNYYEMLSDDYDVKFASGPIYLKRFSQDRMVMLPKDYIHGVTKVTKFLCCLSNARSLFRQVRNGELVILQQGAEAAAFVGIALFFHRKARLFMIQYSIQPMQIPWRRLVYNLFCKKKISGCICPKDDVGKAFGVPYITVPDYIYCGKNSFSQIPYSQRSYDFSILGRLNPDKGIIPVIEKFKTLGYSLLVAGNPDSQEFAKELESACSGSGNIHLSLGYLSDEDYDGYIKDSRFCILNYQKEYSRRSSGVVYDIIFRGVPVVGNSCESLQFIEDKALGILYKDIDNFEIDLNSLSEKYPEFVSNIESYCSIHRSYVKKLLQFLQSHQSVR